MDNYLAPSYDEIQTYVSVGPNFNSSVTLSKGTFDLLVILVVIGLIGLVLLIITMTGFYAHNQSRFKPIPPIKVDPQTVTLMPTSGLTLSAFPFSQTYKSQSIELNEVYSLDFYPTTLFNEYNYSKLRGIYSLQPLDLTYLNDLIFYGNGPYWYIHQPGTELNVPPDFKYKLPIYVTYHLT